MDVGCTLDLGQIIELGYGLLHPLSLWQLSFLFSNLYLMQGPVFSSMQSQPEKEFFRTAQPNPFLFPLLFPSVSPSSTFPPHPAKWPLKSSGIGGGAPTTNAVWHTSSSENVSSDIICVFMLSCIGQYHIMCNPHYGNDQTSGTRRRCRRQLAPVNTIEGSLVLG